MKPLLFLAAILASAPVGAQPASFESSLLQARRSFLQAAAPPQRPVLRLPIADVRQEQSKAFLARLLGGQPVGISMGFGAQSMPPEDWGKFRVAGEELVFSFSELKRGVERAGVRFELVYENAQILRLTRLSDGARAQASYIELLEMLAHEGPKIRLGGLEFALFAEEGLPIPATISLVQDRSLAGERAYRIYSRSGAVAGERITWFFTQDGLEYGLRPEGGWIVFYAR